MHICGQPFPLFVGDDWSTRSCVVHVNKYSYAVKACLEVMFLQKSLNECVSSHFNKQKSLKLVKQNILQRK